jgi:hypothetical protein
MADEIKVDVAVNIYGKPYQTVLSILSLLKYSKNHINNIFIVFRYRRIIRTKLMYIVVHFIFKTTLNINKSI